MNPLLAVLLAVAVVVRPIVSVDARGSDVRDVLVGVFNQAKRPYALDKGIQGKLYMRFDRLPYDKALEIVAQQAGLVVKERNGVVLVSPADRPATESDRPSPSKAAPSTAKRPAPAKPTPSRAAVLARRVTVRLSRAPLATVFATLGKQASVGIDLKGVPAYRVDAAFTKAPLQIALDQVCGATGLRYAFTDGRIVVTRR